MHRKIIGRKYIDIKLKRIKKLIIKNKNLYNMSHAPPVWWRDNDALHVSIFYIDLLIF
jgi:hypothetical protein